MKQITWKDVLWDVMWLVVGLGVSFVIWGKAIQMSRSEPRIIIQEKPSLVPGPSEKIWC